MSTIAAPPWFEHALDTPYEHGEIEVEGCPIRYLVWGDVGKPGLLLVHGNGAHAYWWSFIAPFFLDHYRVAAINLGGMGDSGYRERYRAETFAAELMAVCQHAELGERPIIVGHSFGGFISLKAGTLFGDQLTGVVLVDAPVRPPDYKWEFDPKRSPIRPKRYYPDFDTAVGRFRLMPPQDCGNDYVLEFIARHSVVETEGGWSWKFDDQLFKHFKRGNMANDLASLKCRVGVIYGEQSEMMNQDTVDYMFGVLDQNVPFVAIPEAHHHLMLDQPLAFIASLRTLLAEWRHSRPLRGG